jgi:hypothetical protein
MPGRGLMMGTATTVSQKEFDNMVESRKIIAEAEAARNREAIGPEGFQAFKVAMEHGVHGGYVWNRLEQDIFRSSLLFKDDLERAIREDYECQSIPGDSERVWAESPQMVREYYLRKAMGFAPVVTDHHDATPPDCMTMSEQEGCLNYRECEWWHACVVNGYVSALAAGWYWKVSEQA